MSSSKSWVQPETADPTWAKPERMLSGFPWVSAIVLYSLSWGWSLLRPNTFYWDDWEGYFNKPSGDAFRAVTNMGRAPWAGIAELLLLKLGVWAVTVATFLVFFCVALFLFEVLTSIKMLTLENRRLLVLAFLLIPVMHARVAVSIFDYSFSYFLFYLGWFLLIKYRSNIGFVASCIVLFLSFKTHSFLFFVLLPFLHFAWLHRQGLKNLRQVNRVHLQLLLLASLPVLYVIARQLLWPPIDSWQDYQQPTWAGVVNGLWLVVLALLFLGVIGYRYKMKRTTHHGVVILGAGFAITALALFPYFAGELYVGFAGRPAIVTVFEFRADWRSRHQLLMPLGLALGVVGLNELLKQRFKNKFFGVVLALSVGLNMFWGSQYFLMSHKQEQLVELFKTTAGESTIASVEDLAMQFNGRGSSFRGYEWSGFMTLAGISTDRPGCEALPTGSALTLKSNRSYLEALVTRDLDLYFEVKPCSEVLAKDG